MKVIKIDATLPTPVITFNLVGRKVLQTSDVLAIVIQDEYNGKAKTGSATFTSNNEMNHITISNSDNYFKHNHKYNLTIYLGSEVFYEGQIICLNNGENVQDFKHTEITNNKLKF